MAVSVIDLRFLVFLGVFVFLDFVIVAGRYIIEVVVIVVGIVICVFAVFFAVSFSLVVFLFVAFLFDRFRCVCEVEQFREEVRGRGVGRRVRR